MEQGYSNFKRPRVGNFKYQKKGNPSESQTQSTREYKDKKGANETPAIVNKVSLEKLKQPPVLLTDQQVAQFIVDGTLLEDVSKNEQGYLVLYPGDELPNDFHSKLYAQAESFPNERGSNPGNNILPVLPEVGRVFETPTVRGALTSLLGENYVMHPHRHPHMNPPGFKAQQLHKDSYWGYSKPRHHNPRWVMAMYYPQEVTLALGPTAVVPRTQYLHMPKTKDRKRNDLPPEWGSSEIQMKCRAGCVVIIHYDIWHRGTANNGDKNRYMFKFQFLRTQNPQKPSWQNTSPEWPLSDKSYKPDMTPVWKSIWNWMLGKEYQNTLVTPVKSLNTKALLDKISDPSPGAEPERLNAAYTLAQCGALDALLHAFHQSTEHANRSAAYGLCHAGAPAVSALQKDLSHNSDYIRANAAFVLGEILPPATEAVKELARVMVKDRAVIVRRNAAEALGVAASLLTPPQTELTAAFITALKDDDDQVRFQACLSVMKLAKILDQKELLVALEECLQDTNRYLRAYALLALRAMDSPESKELLFNSLFKAYYCPLTTKDSPF